MSFAESTMVPIPLETVVAPLMVGHPKQSLKIAKAIWIGCLLGAIAFYLAGAWLAEPVVRPALEALGLQQGFADMSQKLDGDGLFWTVFLVSFSPAPMQFATLGAGAIHGNFFAFLSAIALSRGVRYFGLAVLAQIVGPRIAEFQIPKRYLVPGLILIFVLVWGIMQLL
jgi:membrane protein YqaA with SNARE-associated domain